MTESTSPAPPAVVSGQRTASDLTVRWLLIAVLLAVLVAWWHLSNRLTDVESNVSNSVSSVSVGTSFLSTDPVQCWMFGVGITGDKAKVDALAKGDLSHDCIRHALQGARGEYLEP
jgi:hypothetical protein